ncbi:hypothetical protein AURDEDRAFT_187400 [Auricularia subglabra TFB-10046 SS5]|nr:hypothetical protein AURDEDRAFT_187400 [Auricularia subglabra TFB-10046 SS5]
MWQDFFSATATICVVTCALHGAMFANDFVQPLKCKLAAVVADDRLEDAALHEWTTAPADDDSGTPPNSAAVRAQGWTEAIMIWVLFFLDLSWIICSFRIAESLTWSFLTGFTGFFCFWSLVVFLKFRPYALLYRQTETLCIQYRCRMIDGIVIPPLLALFVLSTNHEGILGEFGKYALAFPMVYASQSLFWIYLFCRSLQESYLASSTMAVLEFPTVRDMPRFGTFVAIALDPESSLAALDDATVEVAAQKMVTGKRLVMVDMSIVMHPRLTYHKFHPIGSGLPQDGWASVPVHPATEHPEHRSPIRPSQPLPVQNAYVHTAESFHGPISRIYLNNPTGISCTDEDRGMISRLALYDFSRMDIERRASERHDDATEGSCDGSESEVWGGGVRTFMQPMYQMWLHIDPNESFAEPSTLQDEIQQLCAIETEWRERREAETESKVDRLQAWRDGVDIPQDPTEDELSPRDWGTLDTIISPEDAIGEEHAGTPAYEHVEDQISQCSIQVPCVMARSDVLNGQASGEVLKKRCEHTPPPDSGLGDASPEATRATDGWIRSVRDWVDEGSRFVINLSGVLSVLVPGGWW